MIRYTFEYSSAIGVTPSRPQWVKVITDSNGIDQRTLLNFENKEEFENLSVPEVYTHLDNLVQYIKDISSELSPIGIDEPIPSDGWHFNGNWGEIEWAKDECFRWWESVYYRNEPDEEESVEPNEEEPA
jgi:hypothetical protein